ncbi:MAG: hypothetical protein LBF63_12160 [Treponema sp.]|nr:hypothetical protein [Treponema sp.]
MSRFSLLLQGAVFVVLCFTACAFPVDPYAGNRNYNKSNFESRTFNVQRVDTDAWYTLRALKLAEGTYCIVFVSDTELGSVSASLAKYIANDYDTNIYGAMTSVFGDYMGKGFDVDGNGKTILLLLDIQDGYSGSGGYVAGYFDSDHMYNISTKSKSNQADMLFIDVNPQSPRSMGFYVTLAHELQHLINFAIHEGTPQETWLNEGLSSAAEYLYGGHQEARISYFNDDPEETIARGNNFFVWDGHWEKNEGDSLANYATVYLFFQWLRIHAGGSGIYSAIASSEYRNYQAVTQTVKSRISGITETEDAKIWQQILSSWMIANYRNDRLFTSLYGYKGELETSPKKIASSSELVYLFPGEGVFSDKTSVQGPISPAGNINYAEIEKPGLSIGNSAPVSGSVLLSYNANINPEGPHEQAYVYPAANQSLTQEALTGRAALSPEGAALPQSYPIGAHDLRFHRPPAESGPSPESAISR